MRIGLVSSWGDERVAEAQMLMELRAALSALGHDGILVDVFGLCETEREEAFAAGQLDLIIDISPWGKPSRKVPSVGCLWVPKDSITVDLLSHDFLVSASPSLYQWVREEFRNDLPERMLRLNHTNCGPVFSPDSDREVRFFFAGNNWDRSWRHGGRGHELLKQLDRMDRIAIYGPSHNPLYEGWRGFRNYRGPIASEAGAVVETARHFRGVLSIPTAVHMRDEIATSRIFEGMAAGSLVAAPDTPMYRDFLDESGAFYPTTVLEESKSVRTRLAEVTAQQVCSEITGQGWSSVALKAQENWRENLMLSHQLRELLEEVVRELPRIRHQKASGLVISPIINFGLSHVNPVENREFQHKGPRRARLQQRISVHLLTRSVKRILYWFIAPLH